MTDRFVVLAADQLSDLTAERYEAPTLVEVGDIVELTNGTRAHDTADMKRYYY